MALMIVGSRISHKTSPSTAMKAWKLVVSSSSSLVLVQGITQHTLNSSGRLYFRNYRMLYTFIIDNKHGMYILTYGESLWCLARRSEVCVVCMDISVSVFFKIFGRYFIHACSIPVQVLFPHMSDNSFTIYNIDLIMQSLFISTAACYYTNPFTIC